MNAETSRVKDSVTKDDVSIDPATSIGTVDLTVADLDRQLEFYQKYLGFVLHRREAGMAALGAGGEDLLRLHEIKGAKRYPRRTGLYHFAVLFPSQRELAKAVARLFALKYVNHPTDHINTKTTYLSDPEGQEIELYADSPEDGTLLFVDGRYEARRADGSWSDGREALDLDALFAKLQPGDKLDEPIPAGTRMGHVHLYVRNLDEAVEFYHGVLGFDLMGMGLEYRMAFVSAGGYHHHIGLNTWMGDGAPPQPPQSQGLRHFAVKVSNADERDRITARVRAAGLEAVVGPDGTLIHDPSGNGVLISVAGQ